VLKAISQIPAGLLMLHNAPALFDRLYRFDWYSDQLRDWAGSLNIQPDMQVLDLGCGPGNLTRELAAGGVRITGVDKSEAMIKRAKRPQSRAQFKVDNATGLDMGAASFDVVLSASLINVVPEPSALLSEMARVLGSHGRASVLFPTPQFDPAHAEQIITTRRLKPFAAGAIRLWAGKARKLDPAEVSQYFMTSGFETPVVDRYLEGGLAAVTAYASA